MTQLRAEWTNSSALDVLQWSACEAAAMEPNPLYGPAFLGPLAQHVLQRDIEILAVWHKDDLVGVFPVGKSPLASGLRGLALSLLASPYIASSRPLIRAEPVAAWRVFLDAVAARSGLVLMPLLPRDGVIADALSSATEAGQHRIAILAQDERPAIASSLDPAAYTARYSAKRRKGLNSRRKALDNAGDVVIRSVAHGDEASEALDAFLELEAAGWKGKAGTALASHAGTLAFARAALSAQNVEFDTLSLNGQIIAVNVNIVSGGTAFAFKSAYDEDFATFSPGAVLDQHTLAQALRGASYHKVDSCATSQHHLMDYWLERQPVATLLVATKAGGGAATLAAAIAAAKTAGQVKALVKTIRSKISR